MSDVKQPKIGQVWGDPKNKDGWLKIETVEPDRIEVMEWGTEKTRWITSDAWHTMTFCSPVKLIEGADPRINSERIEALEEIVKKLQESLNAKQPRTPQVGELWIAKEPKYSRLVLELDRAMDRPGGRVLYDIVFYKDFTHSYKQDDTISQWNQWVIENDARPFIPGENHE